MNLPKRPAHAAQDAAFERLLKQGERRRAPIRMGDYWEGNLEGWLADVLSNGDHDGVQDWSFPTDSLRDEYLASVHDRELSDVMALLRLFVFDQGYFSCDDRHLGSMIDKVTGKAEVNASSEYERALLAWRSGTGIPHVGVRWALDLLAFDPRRTIAAVEAYAHAEYFHLPPGPVAGLFDALAVMRARFLANPKDSATRRESLSGLTSRQFEVLVLKLFLKIGYEVILTPAVRDGGRDIDALQHRRGRRETVAIECKLYTKRSVGVEKVRALQGVVSHDPASRGRASRGILVTSSEFTRGARKIEETDARIELIDGLQLVEMLDSEIGEHWPSLIDRLVDDRSAGSRILA